MMTADTAAAEIPPLSATLLGLQVAPDVLLAPLEQRGVTLSLNDLGGIKATPKARVGDFVAAYIRHNKPALLQLLTTAQESATADDGHFGDATATDDGPPEWRSGLDTDAEAQEYSEEIQAAYLAAKHRAMPAGSALTVMHLVGYLRMLRNTHGPEYFKMPSAQSAKNDLEDCAAHWSRLMKAGPDFSSEDVDRLSESVQKFTQNHPSTREAEHFREVSEARVAEGAMARSVRRKRPAGRVSQSHDE